MAGRILCGCLLLISAAGAAPKKGEYEDPKKDPEFVKGVNQAIERGVEWLFKQQATTGRFPAAFRKGDGAAYQLGMHALGTLAAIKSVGHVEDKRIQKALRQLHTLFKRHRTKLYTYEVGLCLMVLDAQAHAEPAPKKGKKKKKRSGSKKKKRQKKKKIELGPKEKEMAEELVRWLQVKQNRQGFWRYPHGGQDLSNAQYAALGLWSAHRMGLKVDKGVISRMIDRTLAVQQEKGVRVPFILSPKLHKHGGARKTTTTIPARGWRYFEGTEEILVDGKPKKIKYPYSGSMTSAGIAVLGIGRTILGKKDPRLTAGKDAKIRRAMWEGFGWLQLNWELRDNPGQPGNWPFYWIYGLERAGRVAGTEFIGGRDWYHEGAVRLVGDQRDDGSWPRSHRMRPKGGQNTRWWSDQVDTCFALLFLTKSTPEIPTPPPTISGN